MTLKMAEAVSLRVIKQVKEGVSGCGKETDVLILDSNGSLTQKNHYDYRYELKMVDLHDDVLSILSVFLAELDMPSGTRWNGIKLAFSVFRERLEKIRKYVLYATTLIQESSN